MTQLVTKCLNRKCKSEQIRYDKKKHVLHCDKCKFKWKVKPHTPQRPCPECGSTDIIYDEDETYCNNCKIVLSASIKYSGGDMIELPWGLLI